MGNKTAALLPGTNRLLADLGVRLMLARKRRKISAKQMAERAGMSPMTLRSVERGGSGVTIGAYAAVLQVLGLDRDLSLVAAADSAGREIQDLKLLGERNREKRTAESWDSISTNTKDFFNRGKAKIPVVPDLLDSESLAKLIDTSRSKRNKSKRNK